MNDSVRIWSFEHNSWWKPASLGYTPDENEAGIYTRQEAEKIVNNANITGVINEEIREILTKG